MNDFWGLDYFTVARYYHGGEYDSQVCAPFIASLPADIQLFVFEAVLAVDLGGFDSDVWETFPVEYRSAVYGMIEHAAPEFLRRYLAKELKSQTVQTNPTVLAANLDKQLSAIPDRIQEVGQRVEDFGDSLKAGQMEIIRRIDRQPKRAVDFEPRLVEVLGDKLYFRLDNGTQRDLQLAEYNFSNNPEPDDYFPSIDCFYRAFEKEFRQRILQPIVRSLVDKGYVNYPSGGSEKPLLMNRTFNKMAALGQVLGLLDKDAVVREIVNGLGLHADEICRSSRELKRMRNMAVHDDLYRREDAARVRNMVLGENSILRLLFTET